MNKNFHISQQKHQIDINEEEQFVLALQAILPEIQAELMKDIQQQLQAEFLQKYQKAILQITDQGQQQYQKASQQLQQSKQMLEEQKKQQIMIQISQLQETLSNILQQQFISLQQRFLQQSFDNLILTHPSIIQLQNQIQQQIYNEYSLKHEQTKQRQLKQLIISHQNKQIKIRKQLDKDIKERIYQSNGLQQMKQQIKDISSAMGSLKSQYNLKLKKINYQIRQYDQKIKDIQNMADIQVLRTKYDQLRIQLLDQQDINNQQSQNIYFQQNQSKEQANQDHTHNQYQDQHNTQDQQSNQDYQNNQNQQNHQYKQNGLYHQDDSLDQIQQENTQISNYIQKNSERKLKRTSQLQLNANNLIRQQLDKNNYSEQEQSQNYHQDKHQYHQQHSRNPHKKFDLKSYFRDYLIGTQKPKIKDSYQSVSQANIKRESLLNLTNVAQLLKQKVSLDPLQRYINKQKSADENIAKQNNPMNINTSMNGPHANAKKSSNFGVIYEQHLKNLNKGYGKKSDCKSSKPCSGLSQMTKKAIIKNLSDYHRKTFKQTHQYQNSELNLNTNQTNLLSTYK